MRPSLFRWGSGFAFDIPRPNPDGFAARFGRAGQVLPTERIRTMSRATINRELSKLGVKRFDLIEAARNRIKGNAYPRGSCGRDCYHCLTRNRLPEASLTQWKCAYVLARASLA